jgi:hypothetical protein
LLDTHPGPLLVPTLVIAEVAYLIATRLGSDAEVRFLGDLAAGTLITEPVAAGDVPAGTSPNSFINIETFPFGPWMPPSLPRPNA